MADVGRPEGSTKYDEEQYEIWLKEMAPFLRRGKSLYKAIELSGLLSVKNRIYQKYNEKGNFWEKIEVYQQELGELLHDAQYDLIVDIHTKVKAKQPLTSDEVKILTFNSEKLRSAQKYWVNRFETAEGKSVDEVINTLTSQADETIDDVNEHLKDGEQPKLPQEATPANVNETLPVVDNATPNVNEQQPEPPIVEGQITPGTIDPNATSTT
jgi:hypothetical protein